MNNHFSKNLQWLRKKKKLSQSRLASKVGLTRNNIASYESGKAEPNIEKLSKLADFFEVDLGQLIQADLRTLPESAIRAPWGPDQDRFSQDETLKQLQKDKIVQFRKILEGFKSFFQMKHQSLKSEVPITDEEKAERNLSIMIELAESSVQLNEEMAGKYLI